MKVCIKGQEFKYYDILKAAQEGLKKEFFTAYPNYEDPEKTYLISENHQEPYLHSWKIYPLKYMPPYHDVIKDDLKNVMEFSEKYKDKFPTACSLISYFGDSVKTASYLVLDSHSSIDWHHDVENPHGEMCCVHIPLDVPKGDLGLELKDEEVLRWDDIFAWNNQILHRAWNKTDNPRLIFLLDFTKESCGLD
jgi:hypothetical protein